MSIKDAGLIHCGIQVCGTRRALAARLGVSERKLRMLCAGRRKLWLGYTIPVRLKPGERHLLRAITKSSP